MTRRMSDGDLEGDVRGACDRDSKPKMCLEDEESVKGLWEVR